MTDQESKTMDKEQRHLFTNGVDTVIAKDLQHADEVYQYITGDQSNDPWEAVPDSDLYTVLFDDSFEENRFPEGAVIRKLGDDEGEYPFTISVTAPASTWASCDHFRDDMLCTTELDFESPKGGTP